MSIPTMSRRVWNRIKALDPIEGGEKNGCWDINGDIQVLFNSNNIWELRAWEDDPPRPPQGTMENDWSSIKGGTLNAEANTIQKDDVDWAIHHEEGTEEEPGKAIPEQA